MKKIITIIIAGFLAISSVFAQDEPSRIIPIKDTVRYFFTKNNREDSIVKGYSSRIIANESYVTVSVFGKKKEIVSETIYKHVIEESYWTEDENYENIYFELLAFNPKNRRHVLWFLKSKKSLIIHVHLVEVIDNIAVSTLCLGNLKE